MNFDAVIAKYTELLNREQALARELEPLRIRGEHLSGELNMVRTEIDLVRKEIAALAVAERAKK